MGEKNAEFSIQPLRESISENLLRTMAWALGSLHWGVVCQGNPPNQAGRRTSKSWEAAVR